VVLAVIVAVLTCVSVGVSLLATVEFARGLRALRRGSPPEPVRAVLSSDSGAGVPAALIRSAAVSAHGAPVSVRVARTPRDVATQVAVSQVRAAMPDADLSEVVAAPPPRHVAGTWLAAAAASEAEGIIVFLDHCARPSSREVGPAASSLRDGAVDLAAVCPHPSPAERSPGAVAGARLAGEMTPLLAAVFGGPGPVPVLVAARGSVVEAAALDPLALNRPCLATAVALSLPRSRSVLLPRTVGCVGADPAATPRVLLARHLLFLSRLAPARTTALAAHFAAWPMALAAALAQGFAGGAGLVLAAALACAVASRLLVAATWSATVQGPWRAMIGFVISPIRDLASLGVLAHSIRSRRVRVGGALFAMRRGGILSPASEGE